MRSILKFLAVILAIGATAQTIKTYADEKEFIDLATEETIIQELIDWKTKVDERKEILRNNSHFSAPPEIPLPESLEKPEDFKRVFTERSLRYIRGLNATEELKNELLKKELWDRHGIVLRQEPGI